MARSITLNFYADPGHGWARVSMGLLHGLKIAEDISSYSYRRNDYAYLEEDCDFSRLVIAAKAADIDIKLRHFHTNKQSKIRSYQSYSTPNKAAAYEAAIKARIQAQGCSADFINNQLIIKVIA